MELQQKGAPLSIAADVAQTFGLLSMRSVTVEKVDKEVRSYAVQLSEVEWYNSGNSGIYSLPLQKCKVFEDNYCVPLVTGVLSYNIPDREVHHFLPVCWLFTSDQNCTMIGNT